MWFSFEAATAIGSHAGADSAAAVAELAQDG
jgi:hypothetical protein